MFTLFKKENIEYTTLGWSSYQCDPTFGLLIIFVFVKPDYRNEGIGTAILQSLQLFCSKNTGKMQTLIWFTKGKQSTSNQLVRYYRNLVFHPTLPMNYCLSHVLPTSLVKKLHQQTNDPQNEDLEFILESKSKIEKIQNEIQLNKYRTREDLIPKCEMHGIDINIKMR